MDSTEFLFVVAGAFTLGRYTVHPYVLWNAYVLSQIIANACQYITAVDDNFHLWERRVEQTRISAKEQGTRCASECQRRDACRARHLQALLCLPLIFNKIAVCINECCKAEVCENGTL